MSRQGRRIGVAEGAARIAGGDRRFAVLMQRGQLTVELYQPRRVDPQQPHTRDEAYVVVEGHGTFVLGAQRLAFGPGDFLFVPAGVEHRFEDFGETLTVWVIFYGPEGGEDAELTDPGAGTG